MLERFVRRGLGACPFSCDALVRVACERQHHGRARARASLPNLSATRRDVPSSLTYSPACRSALALLAAQSLSRLPWLPGAMMPPPILPHAAPACAGRLPGYLDRSPPPGAFSFSPPLFYLLCRPSFTFYSPWSPRVFSGAGVESESITIGGLYRRPV